MGFFGEKSTPIDKAVIEATDEAKIREDWSQIIKVCNLINESPEEGSGQAVAAIRKRLATKNSNIQLFSLTLLNALAQNCGTMVAREIASTATTQALLKLGTASNAHRNVVIRLLEILEGLADQYEQDPSLKQIRVTYDRIRQHHPSLLSDGKTPTSHGDKRERRHGHHSTRDHKEQKEPKGTRGNRHKERSEPPSRPSRVNNEEEEDEDLKRALELSLQEAKERESRQNVISRANSSQSTADSQTQTQIQSQRPSLVRALYDFTASEEGELSFKTGDVVTVVESVYKDWWRGTLNGNSGIFPVNYVEPVNESSPSNRNGSSSTLSTPSAVDDEAYIFALAPTVEKLLSIFATASQHPGYGILGNQDVQRLYNEVSSIRPKLVQMIEEYSNKKNELMNLNLKVMEARKAYDHLLEVHSTQPRQAPTTVSATNGISNGISNGTGREGWYYTPPARVVDPEAQLPQPAQPAQYQPYVQTPQPQAPIPQAPTPQAPTPQVPTPQVPSQYVAVPQAPTPQVSQVPQAPSPYVQAPSPYVSQPHHDPQVQQVQQVQQIQQIPQAPQPHQVSEIPQIPQAQVAQIPQIPQIPQAQVSQVPQASQIPEPYAQAQINVQQNQLPYPERYPESYPVGTSPLPSSYQ